MNISLMSACMSVNGGIDPEYLRIIRELRALGIEPTGDKTVDKRKLEEAKKVMNLQKTDISKYKDSENTRYSNVTQENEQHNENLAEQMAGTLQLSELNKLFILKRVV